MLLLTSTVMQKQDMVNAPGHTIFVILQIIVREHRRGNQKWTIQGNWQHTVGTHDE